MNIPVAQLPQTGGRPWEPIKAELTVANLFSALARSNEPDGAPVDFTSVYHAARPIIRREFDIERARQRQEALAAQRAEMEARRAWGRSEGAQQVIVLGEERTERNDLQEINFEEIAIQRSGIREPENSNVGVVLETQVPTENLGGQYFENFAKAKFDFTNQSI